jgi:uncharacterized protein
MKLSISKELSLPIESVTQTFAILAKRRVGKTYTASVMAEEFVKANLPFCVLDPTGAWWGLRSGKDGSAKGGLPIYVIGGQHGIALEPTAGKVIAEQVATHPAYYVIDVSQFESNAAQDRFATDFGERLYRIKEKHREPMHLFIDEADAFVPQRPMPGQQRMLGAFEAIVRRGGIRGIGITLISQRPAVVNKNVLTQSECLIVLQTTSPQDQDAIDEWIKRNGTDEDRKTLMGSLASLQKGEAWIYSPAWLEVFQKVHIRERETFNSSATPKAGEKIIVPKLAEVDMAKLSDQIKSTVEQTKLNDPSELKKKIRELEIELKKKVIPQSTQVDPSAIEKEANKVKQQYETVISRLQKELTAVKDSVIDNATHILSNAERLVNLQYPKIESPKANQDGYKYRIVAGNKYGESMKGAYSPTISNLDKNHPPQGSELMQLPSGAKRLLEVLVAWHPNSITEGHWRSNAGLRKTGTFSNYKSLLITQGLISKDGDKYQATQAGIDWFGDDRPQAPQTTEEVLSIWNSKLPDGARRMLKVLVEHRGEPVSEDTLLEESQLKKTGTFSNYKSMLITAKLIKKNGNMLAADKETLFL